MIIHGIDLVDTTRTEFVHEHLYTRVLHPHEYSLYLNMANEHKKVFLAKYWAIKEAIFKSLPTKIPLHKIQIEKSNDVYLYQHKTYDFTISISSADRFIIASVIGFKKSC